SIRSCWRLTRPPTTIGISRREPIGSWSARRRIGRWRPSRWPCPIPCGAHAPHARRSLERFGLVPLEVLDLALVLFGRIAAGEGAEVPALSVRTLLARIEA